MFPTQGFHIQEDGYIYSIRNLIDIEHTLVPTRLCIMVHVKVPNHTSIYNRLPEDETLSSKHVENLKN